MTVRVIARAWTRPDGRVVSEVVIDRESATLDEAAALAKQDFHRRLAARSTLISDND